MTLSEQRRSAWLAQGGSRGGAHHLRDGTSLSPFRLENEQSRERDPTLLADLKRIENDITTSERPSILARWECGHKILACYQQGAKQLAGGFLDCIASELGVCRSEVGARVKFAKKYPRAEEVSTLVESVRSWTAIRQEKLTDTPRTSKRQRTPLQQAFIIVEKIDPVDLDASDIALIERFHACLARLAAGIAALRSDKAA